MKKISLLLSILLIPSLITFAQLKIGYVDSDTIMEKLPEAQDAQKRLDALVQEWQDELAKKENDFKRQFNEYDERKLIMSQRKRAQIEKQLMKLEKEIADFKQKKFGHNGELYKNQEELMKPIQNKIFNAIQEVAKDEELDFVFDRSGDIVFLYAKEKFDVTNLVLEKLK